jgi:hypothetical protein
MPRTHAAAPCAGRLAGWQGRRGGCACTSPRPHVQDQEARCLGERDAHPARVSSHAAAVVSETVVSRGQSRLARDGAQPAEVAAVAGRPAGRQARAGRRLRLLLLCVLLRVLCFCLGVVVRVRQGGRVRLRVERGGHHAHHLPQHLHRTAAGKRRGAWGQGRTLHR